MYSPEQLDTIRRLNDAARQSPGVTSCANVTQGFLALPNVDRFKAVSSVSPSSTATTTPMVSMISARSIA